MVYGYPGGAIMPFYDALERTGALHHVLVRHEQGAVFAASGAARVGGEAGVAIATSGPGATNLITGITDAQADGVPLFVITGQVASPLLGTEAFQEAPIPEMVAPVTKYCAQVTPQSDIRQILEEAWSAMCSGRPGPVLIDITKDAQQAVFATYSTALADAVELLKGAERPLILFGKGATDATASLQKCIAAHHIPAVCTLHGLSVLPSDTSYFFGMAGMHGHLAANHAIQNADVILALGVRFDDRLTGRVEDFAPRAEIIHVDVSARQIGRVVPTAVGLVGKVSDLLPQIDAALTSKPNTDWVTSLREKAKEEERAIITPNTQLRPGRPTMAYVLSCVSKRRSRKATFVSDVGQHQMSAARYLRLRDSDRLLNSGGLGSMGFALPAAIGAAFAGGAKERDTFVIVGDGSFQMSLQELATAVQEGVPIKVLLLNNGYLGMVRQWQELFFGKTYSQVAIGSPKIAAIAKAYGCSYLKADATDTFNEQLDAFLSVEGPVIYEVAVVSEENVFPIVPAGASLSEMKLCP